MSLGTTLKRHFPEQLEWKGQLRQVFKAYVTGKQERNVIDFDDMLLGWAEMLKHKELADLIGRRFDHALVDEYQDSNILQAKILKRLKPDGRGVTVIGDDAQAIYGFRGAEASNILEFPKQYEPAAIVIKLVLNYRSTQAVLDASNAVIGLAGEGYKKVLQAVREGGDKPELVTTVDDHAQAAFVVGRVRKNLERGRALKQQAFCIAAV